MTSTLWLALVFMLGGLNCSSETVGCFVLSRTPHLPCLPEVETPDIKQWQTDLNADAVAHPEALKNGLPP